MQALHLSSPISTWHCWLNYFAVVAPQSLTDSSGFWIQKIGVLFFMTMQLQALWLNSARAQMNRTGLQSVPLNFGTSIKFAWTTLQFCWHHDKQKTDIFISNWDTKCRVFFQSSSSFIVSRVKQQTDPCHRPFNAHASGRGARDAIRSKARSLYHRHGGHSSRAQWQTQLGT